MKKVILFLLSTTACFGGHHKRQLTEYFTLNRMFDVVNMIANSKQDVDGSDLESDDDNNTYSFIIKPAAAHSPFAAIQQEIATEYNKRQTTGEKEQYLASIEALTKEYPEMLDQITIDQ